MEGKLKEEIDAQVKEHAKTGIFVAGDYVEKKEVQYEIGNVESGGIGINIVNNKSCAPIPVETETTTEKQNPNYSEQIELFKYIHYNITSPEEKLNIHKQICNIVGYPKMQLICDALVELMNSKKILSSIDQSAMLAELHRLGMPSEGKGFSDQNFYSYYRTK
jgi:hypothetical protein